MEVDLGLQPSALIATTPDQFVETVVFCSTWDLPGGALSPSSQATVIFCGYAKFSLPACILAVTTQTFATKNLLVRKRQMSSYEDFTEDTEEDRGKSRSKFFICYFGLKVPLDHFFPDGPACLLLCESQRSRLLPSESLHHPISNSSSPISFREVLPFLPPASFLCTVCSQTRPTLWRTASQPFLVTKHISLPIPTLNSPPRLPFQTQTVLFQENSGEGGCTHLSSYSLSRICGHGETKE